VSNQERSSPLYSLLSSSYFSFGDTLWFASPLSCSPSILKRKKKEKKKKKKMMLADVQVIKITRDLLALGERHIFFFSLLIR
jgi:hypothetical protein